MALAEPVHEPWCRGTPFARSGAQAGASPAPRHNAGMNWRERIVADPAVLVGKAVIKGTRISVELVMDLLARGYDHAQVLAQYPHLTDADIQACLAYAAEIVRSERMFGLPA